MMELLRHGRDHAACALAVGLAGLLCLHDLMDPDIGFHLRCGQVLFSTGGIPLHDFMSFTAEGAPYVNLSWIYQAAVYVIFRTGGVPGLILAHAALIMLVWSLLAIRLRREGVGATASAWWLVVAALICEPRFNPRPELVSYVLFLLAGLIAAGRKHWGLLPILFALWANIHGMFPLGWLLVWGALLLNRPASWKDPRLLWAGLSMITPLLNPSGWKLYEQIAQLLGRYHSSGWLSRHIGELCSPWRFSADYGGLPLLGPLGAWLFYPLFVLAAVCALHSLRDRRWAHAALIAAFLWIGSGSIRMSPFFVLGIVPLVASEIGFLWPKRFVRMSAKAGAAVLVCFLTIIVVRFVTGAHHGFAGAPTGPGLGLSETAIPWRTAAFINAHGLKGKVVTDISTGTWLACATPLRVSHHANIEIMGEARVRETVNSLHRGLPGLLTKYQPDYVAFSWESSSGWFKQLTGVPELKCVHVSPYGALFVRRNLMPDAEEIDIRNFATKLGCPPIPTEEVYRLLNAHPPGEWERFWHPAPPALGIGAADALFEAECYYPAARLYLEALGTGAGNTNGWDVIERLADLYDLTGDAPKALICFSRLAAADPGNPRLARVLDGITRHAQQAGKGSP